LNIAQGMRDSAPREFSQPQFSLKNFVDSRSSCQEVFCSYAGTCEGHFWRNASTCGPKVRGGRPAQERSMHERSPVLNLCNQILI
jgi:hypothetical protein